MLYAPRSRIKPAAAPINRLDCEPRFLDLWRGLSLAWGLLDRGGANAPDLSGHGLHGVFGSTLDPATDWAGTEIGPALQFSGGSNEYVQVADPAVDLLDGCSDLSAEVIFELDSTSGTQGLIGKYRPSTGYRAWRLYLTSGQLELQVSDDGTSYESQVTTGLSLSTGTIYQAIVTYEAGTFKVYLDGASQAVDGDFSSELSVYGGSQPLTVGQRRTSSDSAADVFLGRILSVRVWQRALEAVEAALLYEEWWGMYRTRGPFPMLASVHSGAAAAGPWSAGVSIPAGIQSYLIGGLVNGTEYDVQAFTVDETGNTSSGSSIVQGTPASSPAWRGVRAPIVAAQRPPQAYRRLR